MFGITVVIPTSPIPSHPSTGIIDAVIRSVRYHLPHEPIFVLADGIREEQRDSWESYHNYKEALITRESDDQGFSVTGDTFLGHRHQVGLMRWFLPQIKTDLLLFVEHDTPLVTDKPIDWYGICSVLDFGHLNLVRFAHESHILDEHMHLMVGMTYLQGVEFMRTKQFSARPHLATVDFYRRLLERFSPEAKSFIEDKAHSVCQDDSWDTWKMGIYHPSSEPLNIKRSYHLDGRAGGPKFDDSQIF